MMPKAQAVASTAQSQPVESAGLCGRITLYILCIVAWGFSIVAIADCSFLLVDLTETSSYPSYGGSRSLTSYKDYSAYGAFSFDGDREEHLCVRYTDIQFEQYFNTAGKTGRAFGVIAALLAGIVFFLLTIVYLFLEFGKHIVWKISVFLIASAVPAQLLTYLVLLVEVCQENTCIPGIAGGSALVAACLFLVIAVMMGCCVKPPPKPLVSVSDMQAQNRQVGWTLLGMSLLVWMLSVASVADCTFIRFGSRNSRYQDMNDLGLFSFNADSSDHHRCLRYEKGTSFSSGERAGRAFGVLTAVLTGFIMLQVLCLFLFMRHRTQFTWKLIRVETIFAFLFQSLVFVVFSSPKCMENSDVRCLPGPVGIVASLNAVVLLVLVFLCWGTGPPKKPLFKIEWNDEGNDEGKNEADDVEQQDIAPDEQQDDVMEYSPDDLQQQAFTQWTQQEEGYAEKAPEQRFPRKESDGIESQDAYMIHNPTNSTVEVHYEQGIGQQEQHHHHSHGNGKRGRTSRSSVTNTSRRVYRVNEQ